LPQIAIQQQEKNSVEEESNTEEVTTHGYNLRKRLTRHAGRVSMTQTGHVTGLEGNTTTGVEGNIVTIHPKTHTHIMLTQVNTKQGLIKYGEERSQAISKEP
jgi:hypothetical protein